MEHTVIFAVLTFLIAWTGAVAGIVLWITGALSKRVDAEQYERRHKQLEDADRRHDRKLELLEFWAAQQPGPPKYRDTVPTDDRAY